MTTDTERLVVSLEARIRDFEKNFAKANKTAARNFGQIERRSRQSANRLESTMADAANRIAGFGKTMAAGFVGGLLAGGFAGLASRVSEITNAVAEIGDEARRSGLGIEEFQELKYVAEQNRLGVDSLVDGIKELNLRADEFVVTGGGSAAEAFQRLGYDADTLREKLKNPLALFEEIIGKLGDLDRAAQIRIADEIFGGTGGERFVQLIDQGADALAATRQEARDLGIVMDEELIAKADDLDRAFNRVATTVGTALKAAIVEAASALGDFLNLFDETTRLSQQNLEDLYRAAIETREMFGNGAPPTENELALKAELDRRAMDQLREGLGSLHTPDTPSALTVPTRTVGGGGSIREQRDQVAELVAELQNELAMLGQSELEQRINAELRRAGADATDEQRASIRELVTAIETERGAMERLEQAADTAKGLTKDFLGGLISDLRDGVSGADALANAFDRLADKVIDMALDMAINAAFGTVSIGGLGLASGGPVRGPGTGTSDSIPAMLSNGEYVVRASEAGKHLHLLEAINAGRLARFADGGRVSGRGGRTYSSMGGTSLNMSVNAPVTVNGSAGTPEQNADLAAKMAKGMEGVMRGVVTDELRRQMRPGNILNNLHKSR